MKICFLSTMKSLEHARIRRMRRAAASLGYDVVNITPAPNAGNQDSKANLLELPRVKHHFRPEVGGLNSLFAILGRLFVSSKMFVYLLRVNPDICQCHEPDSWAVAILVKWLRGSKVIADILETFETRGQSFPRPLRPSVRKLIRKWMKWMSFHTDYILHVSESRADLYTDFECPAVVVNNYPDIGSFCLAREQKIASADSQDSYTILHAGALRPNYASKQLLEALNIAHDKISVLKLIVLGGTKGPTDSYEDLLDESRQRGLLEIEPFVPYGKVIDYMRSADVGVSLVLPIDLAHEFAVPRKLFEYLAAGLPVIGSDAPDIRRTLEKWECGIVVDSQNPRDIADALIRLYHDPALRASMSRNGRLAAERSLNWESEARKVVEIYSAVCGESV